MEISEEEFKTAYFSLKRKKSSGNGETKNQLNLTIFAKNSKVLHINMLHVFQSIVFMNQREKESFWNLQCHFELHAYGIKF